MFGPDWEPPWALGSPLVPTWMIVCELWSLAHTVNPSYKQLKFSEFLLVVSRIAYTNPCSSNKQSLLQFFLFAYKSGIAYREVACRGVWPYYSAHREQNEGGESCFHDCCRQIWCEAKYGWVLILFLLWERRRDNHMYPPEWQEYASNFRILVQLRLLSQPVACNKE